MEGAREPREVALDADWPREWIRLGGYTPIPPTPVTCSPPLVAAIPGPPAASDLGRAAGLAATW